MSIMYNATQFEGQSRNNSYVKSEMKRHLVAKLRIYFYLRYAMVIASYYFQFCH